MASIKRKAEDKTPAAKKKSEETNGDRASKRQRKDPSKPSKTPTTASDEQVAEKEAPRASILQQEERAFPRGGASALTPLEHKQIQIQATRDVLFEESGQKRTGEMGGSDEEGLDMIAESAAPKKQIRKRKNTSSKKPGVEEDAEEARIKVEGLKYKRITPGCTFLGQVTRITSQDITLDLPNNLTGVVPMTGVSSRLTKKLEALADADEDGDDKDAAQELENTDLKAYFRIGQYLRAAVVSTTDEPSGKEGSKSRKRIELSLDPRSTNPGITKADLCLNCMLQASVASIEDHGLIMDLGISDADISGFVPKKDIPDDVDFSTIKEGTVLLCLVTKFEQNAKVVRLSARPTTAGDLTKQGLLRKAPTVTSILPGAAIELLIAQVSSSTIAGKIMGMVDGTADIVHSGAGARNTDIESKYKIGSKVKARVIFSLGESDTVTVGVSLLDHVLSLAPRTVADSKKPTPPLDALPLSATVDQAKVVNVEGSLGVYVDVGVKGVPGFVHISNLSDGRVESLSQSTGAYRSGTSHRARIIGYNAIDGLFLCSFEKAILEQPYLRIEDVPVGEVVKAKVEKIVVNAAGVGGILLGLAHGISGLVPEMHLSDVHLQHPERKFKEGITITARVLSTDLEKRLIRLTLKKSLVNSDAEVWKDYTKISPGSQSLGTILKITPPGAVVQFFGNVRAFLPVGEMSDAYIQDPSKHFRVGQVVNVHALLVDAEDGRMTVSCRIPSATDAAQATAFAKLTIGDIISGTVAGQSNEDISIDLKDSGIRSTLRLGHLTDGSDLKNASAMKRIRTGQILSDLVIIELFEKKRSVVVSQKPTLVRAAKTGSLVTNFEQMAIDKQVDGYVRSIMLDAIFVGFPGGLSGMLHKTQLTEGMTRLPDFGLAKDRSISARVLSIDPSRQRFFLSVKPKSAADKEQSKSSTVSDIALQATIEPIDKTAESVADFMIGKITSAHITAVKDTQLNVKLAENVQGRIDISEVFSDWKDIKDRKHPLRSFGVSSVIPVKVLGMHDARNHRFLPISHRTGRVPIYELSAKTGKDSTILSLDEVKVGTWYAGFVNGISDMCLWISLSPNVRGRIERMQISEDVSVLNDLEHNFPIGSALRVRVTGVDLGNNRLDLSAKAATSDKALTFDDISAGMILTGRVTKVTERSILVQLSGTVSGLVALAELADDFDQANATTYTKNDIVRVCILDVDKANKRVTLTTRASKVLSSSLSVNDPLFTSYSQLKVNDVVRGFIKNVADVGIFVTLSYNVTAFVRVSELSDAFVKEWKSNFEIDRLVTAKVIAIDQSSRHIQLSMKPSVVSKNYTPQLTFNDLAIGQIVTGKIRKVEEFGAFILVDNSHNVSGLCHKSEIAEQRVDDVRKIYSEGDIVKALVLKVEPEKRRVSLGLKASYFQNIDSEDGSDDEGMSDDEDDDTEDTAGGVDLDTNYLTAGSDDQENDEEEDEDEADKLDELIPTSTDENSLDVGAFDWSGSLQAGIATGMESEAESEHAVPRKKKRKAEIKVDQTGDLDKLGPRSASDFERLLLGQRDSSSLWIQYMAFQLQLSDVEEARAIAERALREINMREQEDKMNVWVAYLNLENAYGTDDSVEEVFKRACEVTDGQQMHERLTSIYIQSGSHQKADDLFRTMLDKKSLGRDSPKLWLNYATFLFDSLSQPNRGRALLDRAMQSVQPHLQRDLVTSFAQLEFKCKNGDPERGRTVFEKLHDTYPKRWDIWDIRVELEKGQGAMENVRDLYERMSSMGMKKRRANFVFKKWLEFEEVDGGERRLDHVKAKALAYVEKHKSQGDRDD